MKNPQIWNLDFSTGEKTFYIANSKQCHRNDWLCPQSWFNLSTCLERIQLQQCASNSAPFFAPKPGSHIRCTVPYFLESEPKCQLPMCDIFDDIPTPATFPGSNTLRVNLPLNLFLQPTTTPLRRLIAYRGGRWWRGTFHASHPIYNSMNPAPLPGCCRQAIVSCRNLVLSKTNTSLMKLVGAVFFFGGGEVDKRTSQVQEVVSILRNICNVTREFANW